MPTPLGMESGAILDSQIRASSIWHPNYAAQQARLHFKAGGGKSGSWSSLFNDNNQWLQVDLQQTTRVKGIATQGKNAFSQWVTRYKDISYSMVKTDTPSSFTDKKEII